MAYGDTKELLDQVIIENVQEDEALKEALNDIQNLYDTKDVHVAAFLMSRGFKLLKAEQWRHKSFGGGKKSPRESVSWHFFFYDRANARASVLRFQGTLDPSVLNVNGAVFQANLTQLKSLVANM